MNGNTGCKKGIKSFALDKISSTKSEAMKAWILNELYLVANISKPEHRPAQGSAMTGTRNSPPGINLWYP